MIKIGDLSKLSYISVKTLRFYDEIGLLKPAQVDSMTGYRYYSVSQLARLQRILALKDLGLSLQQITMLLNGDLPADQMVGMLRRRQVELFQEINKNRAMLARIETRLRQFEQENTMSEIDVTIKSIPALWVASVRGTVPTYPEQDPLWDQLMMAMRISNIEPLEPCFCIDHDPEYKDRDHDLEVCFFVSDAVVKRVQEDLVIEPPAVIRQLPAVETMASLIHHGPFLTLPNAYQDMLHWLGENGYRICGPNREIYIQAGEGKVRQDDPSYITEIQFPVEKM
jgi:DNA-binding transcriptional MerR regulator